MFIISHNNYVIPYDQLITVTKDENRIAKIDIN